MIKFLQKCYNNYVDAHDQLAAAGIFHIITPTGVATYTIPSSKNGVNTTDDKP